MATTFLPEVPRLRRDPMPHNGELIFAVAIVNVPTARLRLFARQRFARWGLGHCSHCTASKLSVKYLAATSHLSACFFGLRAIISPGIGLPALRSTSDMETPFRSSP